MESLWRHFKNSKNDQRRLFMPTSIHTYQKYLNPSGDPVPLNDSSRNLLAENCVQQLDI
jgi:hypothetical protein